MSGRWGRRMRWSAAGAAWSLLLALALETAAGCGGQYAGREAQARPPETCRAAESLPECEHRLQQYASRLDALVGPASSVPTSEADAVNDGLVPSESPVIGAPAGPPPEQASAPTPDAYEAEESAPEGLSEAPAGPDCPAARDLRERICELAEAICALAARSDAEQDTIASCDAARTSCKDARARVGAACPE